MNQWVVRVTGVVSAMPLVAPILALFIAVSAYGADGTVAATESTHATMSVAGVVLFLGGLAQLTGIILWTIHLLQRRELELGTKVLWFLSFWSCLSFFSVPSYWYWVVYRDLQERRIHDFMAF